MAESLFRELKRRNIFKVATAYLVLAWFVIQVTGEAVPALRLPEWVNSLVFFLGAIGFPFVLLFAWAFELTPEGIKRESEVDRTESIADKTGKKLNGLIMGLMAIALIYFIYESRFQNTTSTEPMAVTETAEVVVEPQQVLPVADPAEEVEARLSELPGSSIAVLPFVNMSSDPEQEFFSDGISEEILNVLAKIPNLHVTSRSSAFAFKGKEVNLSDVARKLGVANILEGSVRKAGNKVRITAQLIEAETDKHLWSETYDRELNDIFAIQDEISTAIVTALKEKLAINEINIESAKTVDLAAHEAFLRGRFMIEKRNRADLERAVNEFDRAISIEPGYAPAWMGKAWATIFLAETSYGNIPVEIAVERAQVIIDRAMALNPELAENHAIQGLIFNNAGRKEDAIASYDKAIELNPNYSYAHGWRAGLLDAFSEAQLAGQRTAYRLDPLNILVANNYTYSLIAFGQLNEARKIVDHMMTIDPDHFLTQGSQAEILREQGQIGRSAYYARKAFLTNNTANRAFNYADSLFDLDMPEQAAGVLAQSDYPEWRHTYTNNTEMLLTETRQKYPRAENDRLGNTLRGWAEYLAQDFEAAIRYGETNDLCTDCDFLLHSYKMMGNDADYEAMLARRQARLDDRRKSGYRSIRLIWEEFDLLIVQDQIDQAVSKLEELLARGIPMNRRVYNDWATEPVRQYSKWQELTIKANEIKTRERKIYLDLVAGENTAD